MYLVTFHTNFDANLFSRKAKQWGKVTLKPVPRQLSSSCGTCAVFTPESGELPESELASLSFEKLFKISEDAGKYELLIENE